MNIKTAIANDVSKAANIKLAGNLEKETFNDNITQNSTKIN